MFIIHSLILLLALVSCTDTSVPFPVIDNSPSIIRVGNPANAEATLIGPARYLVGRGSPDQFSFGRFVDTVSGEGQVDVTVISASFPGGDSSTPECNRIIGLDSVNSCTTLTLLSTEEADHQDAVDLVRKSDIVYFAGGNQCNYMRWRDSAVIREVTGLYYRGGGVGGGSAGLAIQGEYVYDGCTGSVQSAEAMANPFDELVSLSKGMLPQGSLEGWITDSHFMERGRLGRLIVFLARIMDDTDLDTWHGIGLDNNATVVIGADGSAEAFGAATHIVKATRFADTLIPGEPLGISGIEVYTLHPGDTFTMPVFTPHTTPVYYSVVNGDLIIHED
jgi:cyanophycinase-like exopeptidase